MPTRLYRRHSKLFVNKIGCDCARDEKIHANVMLAEGTTEERTSLLSCKADALDRVVILRNKRDYDRLRHYEAPSKRDLLT
jgi:hypothetical protein